MIISKRYYVDGEPALTSISEVRIASELQIEEWAQDYFGFVPHLFWIKPCKELYIQGRRSKKEYRRPWHEMSPGKTSGH